MWSLIWHLFKESITDGLRIVCTILAFLIPYTVYKVNQKLHEFGDPPWKRDITGEE